MWSRRTRYAFGLLYMFFCRFIATYHYFRIFNSWNEAFDVKFDSQMNNYKVELTGQAFNDAYRYVDWLLTVPRCVGVRRAGAVQNVFRA